MSTPEKVRSLHQDLTVLVAWLTSFAQFAGNHEKLDDCQTEEDLLKFLDDQSFIRSVLDIAKQLFADTVDGNLENEKLAESWETVREVQHGTEAQWLREQDLLPAVERRISILASLLRHAVSKQCSNSDVYVKVIREMELSSQRSLMELIKKDQAKKSSTPRRTHEDAFGPATSNSLEGESPLQRQRTRDQMNDYDMSSPGSHQMAKYTTEEYEELKRQHDDVVKRELVLCQRMADIEAKHRKEMMKVESAATRKEEETRERLEHQVEALTSKVEEFSSREDEGKRVLEELHALRDEVDVLRHSKEKHKDTEEKLRNYQERLEQMVGLKDALNREEEQHQSSVQECLRLANELSALQSVKSQLEVFKARAFEAEVKLTDCQDDLKRLKAANGYDESNRDELIQLVRMQKEELEQMRMSQSRECDDEGMIGIAEGISELNPEVKAELLRLRNDNAHLQAFYNKRKDDAVEKLEQELENTIGLSHRFKQQFLETKSGLAKTQDLLTASKQREEILLKQVDEMDEELQLSKELADELEEELHATKSVLQSTKVSLTEAKSEMEKFQDEMENWQREAKLGEQRSKELSAILAETRTRLEKEEEALVESNEKCKSLEYDVQQWTNHAQAADKLSSELNKKLDSTENTLQMTQEHLSAFEKERVDMVAQLSDLRREKESLEAILDEELRRGEAALKTARVDFEREIVRHKGEAKLEIEQLQERASRELDTERKRLEKEICLKSDELSRSKEDTNILQQTLRAELKSARMKAEEEKATIIGKHEKEILEITTAATDARNELVDKGKIMLEDIQSKAEDEKIEFEGIINDLHEKIVVLREEKEKAMKTARDKITSCKRKLQFATKRMNELSKDNEHINDKMRNKEREALELREENDRFRRQVGGGFRADGKLHNQLDTLRKEFNVLYEENQQLKEKAKAMGYNSSVSALSYNAPGTNEFASFNGGSLTRTTIGQVRAEYEETVQALVDEKRELIMKNSAAATDVQRAEQRAWDADEKVERLKEELTSVSLKLQRYEATTDLTLTLPDSSTDQLFHQNDDSMRRDESEAVLIPISSQGDDSISKTSLKSSSALRALSSNQQYQREDVSLPQKSPNILDVYKIDAAEARERSAAKRASVSAEEPTKNSKDLAPGPEYAGGDQSECKQS